MPPRSWMAEAGQPNSSSRLVTSCLAASSSPAISTSWSPGTRAGSTITWQFMVFSAFTTRAAGNSRWICSARLSSLATESRGGKPPEKSSGLATSSSVFPARLSAPAARSAATDAVPAVALTISSPWAAASAKLPWAARSGNRSLQATALSLPALRAPMTTSFPTSTSLVPSVSPTMPVPRTPMRMTFSFVFSVPHDETLDGVRLHERLQLGDDRGVQVAQQLRWQCRRVVGAQLQSVRPGIHLGGDDAEDEHRSSSRRPVGGAPMDGEAAANRHVTEPRHPGLPQAVVALRL